MQSTNDSKLTFTLFGLTRGPELLVNKWLSKLWPWARGGQGTNNDWILSHNPITATWAKPHTVHTLSPFPLYSVYLPIYPSANVADTCCNSTPRQLSRLVTTMSELSAEIYCKMGVWLHLFICHYDNIKRMRCTCMLYTSCVHALHIMHYVTYGLGHSIVNKFYYSLLAELSFTSMNSYF